MNSSRSPYRRVSLMKESGKWSMNEISRTRKSFRKFQKTTFGIVFVLCFCFVGLLYQFNLIYKLSGIEDSNWQCVGWRQTKNCHPDSEREPGNDTSCSSTIPIDYSGYCELVHRKTKEKRKVMKSHCRSSNASFTCDMAIQFMQFKEEADAYVQIPPMPHFLQNSTITSSTGSQLEKMKNHHRRGILICSDAFGMINAYVGIRILRDSGCNLPIELWHLQGELYMDDPRIVELTLAYNVQLRQVDDPTVSGWFVKPYAIFYSHFDEVLLLDNDVYVTKDPTYLFETKEFQEDGALFWPDYWLPGKSIFNFHQYSLAWELLGVPYKYMFEQESGQLLIHRKKSEGPLNLVMYYMKHFSIIKKLKILYGDKDLFRFAWFRSQQKFHMIDHPPGSAGFVKHNKFCGVSIVHYDPSENVIFIHRNQVKFTYSFGGRKWWSHIQEYNSLDKDQFGIDMADGWEFDPAIERCFGVVDIHNKTFSNGEPKFNVTQFTSYDFGKLEDVALIYYQKSIGMINQFWIARHWFRGISI